ncbi:MAG: hypothetical protein C6W56_12395 [Caldibacillus debilis]|nr:MAG: hypothetical protein C6W56_12395 [Caldibacillus debilis]
MRPRGKCAAAASPEERAAGAAGAGSPRAAENSVSIVASKKKRKVPPPFVQAPFFRPRPPAPEPFFPLRLARPVDRCGGLGPAALFFDDLLI